MATEIVTDTVETTDDLNAFEAEFYGTSPAKVEEITPEDVPSETPDEDEGDDAPDTEDTVEEPVDEQADEDGDEGEDEEETELFKVKRKKSVGERIREVTAARHEAERRANELERRLAEIEAKSAKTEDPKPKAEPTAGLDSDAPDPDSLLDDGAQKYPLGEFDPKYIRDLTRFTIAKETAAAKALAAEEAQTVRMQEAEQALASHWTEKLEAAKESLPDFGEKAIVLEDTFRDLDPNYGKYLASTIMSLDYGPQVLHYLATNIGEAKKIVASGPTAATLALGRIEARFDKTAKASNEKPRSSKAPAPPPTNRGSGGKYSVSPDTDDLDAFEAHFYNRKK